jgi:pyruvate/2-oxoglutarate dehydrogenase complex dihydrolipoamide acyltransferase (E2) component
MASQPERPSGIHRSACAELPFPRMRNFMIDSSDRARKMNLVYFPFQVDITAARKHIRACAARLGRSVSFTAFVSLCFAKAIHEDEDRRMHAVRKGLRKLVAFEDVDVNVIVEKEVDGAVQPVHVIVRAVNRKELAEVQEEIARAAALPFEQMYSRVDRAFLTWVPRPLRMATYWLHRRFPALFKHFNGTTCVSSIVMFGSGAAYMLPLIPMTSALSIGTIEVRRQIVGSAAEDRELLSLVLSIDHDVVDGAHAMRFIGRFKDLVEAGHGLPAIEAVPRAAAQGA